MATLVWDKSGERRFEAGIDRGVLYPRGGAGVAWNGLLSVNETPDGGGINEYFLDGVKYYAQTLYTDYRASLEAVTYPKEFEACEGTQQHEWGFLVTNQRRASFDLCYRTKMGDDIDGLDRGYKLHLIYNAIANPSNRNYQTASNNPELTTFSWDLSATPIGIAGYRPTSHFIFESTAISVDALAVIEAALYGTETTAPWIPRPLEIVGLIQSTLGLTIVDNGDGTFTATGDDDVVSMIDATTFRMSASNITLSDNGTYVVEY